MSIDLSILLEPRGIVCELLIACCELVFKIVTFINIVTIIVVILIDVIYCSDFDLASAAARSTRQSLRWSQYFILIVGNIRNVGST